MIRNLALLCSMCFIGCANFKYMNNAADKNQGYEAYNYSETDEFKSVKAGVLKGKRDYNILMKTIIDNKYMAQMRTKYNSILLKIPKINGWIFMTLAIDNNGNVMSSNVEKNTMHNGELEGYIVNSSKSWQFNVFPESDTSIVLFKFVFAQYWPKSDRKGNVSNPNP